MSAEILQLSGGKQSSREREAARGLAHPSASTGRAPSPQPLPAPGWHRNAAGARAGQGKVPQRVPALLNTSGFDQLGFSQDLLGRGQRRGGELEHKQAHSWEGTDTRGLWSELL